MKCVICNQRKGKRHCPAKDDLICPRCCGEKRVIEIRCPQDCQYLSDGLSYQWTKTYVGIMEWIEEPGKRRQFYESTQRHGEILSVLELEIVDYSKSLRSLTDSIILEAVETLHKTYQTEDRGVIYEHASANPLAQSLVRDLREAVQRESEESGDNRSRWTRAGIIASLEAIQTQIAYHQAKGMGDRSYLDFLLRSRPEAIPKDESGIIISG